MGEVVFLVFPVQGFETLCRDAERVGDGYANAAGADIEAEDARLRILIGRHNGIIRFRLLSIVIAERRSADSRGRLSPHLRWVSPIMNGGLTRAGNRLV